MVQSQNWNAPSPEVFMDSTFALAAVIVIIRHYGDANYDGQIAELPHCQQHRQRLFPPRNGNLIIAPRPFYLFGEAITASHGTPYSYDTHVPVILFGAGVVAGSYATVSSPADIAPTLSLLLKVEKPSNAVGRILTEAIRDR